MLLNTSKNQSTVVAFWTCKKVSSCLALFLDSSAYSSAQKADVEVSPRLDIFQNFHFGVLARVYSCCVSLSVAVAGASRWESCVM